jgi:hypothetical protein
LCVFNADKLDGFKKHKHKRDKEEESLSLREYVQQMEEKFKKEIGKPSKKRVRELMGKGNL